VLTEFLKDKTYNPRTNGKLLTRLYSTPTFHLIYHAYQRTDAGTQQMYKSEGKVESMIGKCLTASSSTAATAAT